MEGVHPVGVMKG